jgi:hypothetical protein
MLVFWFGVVTGYWSSRHLNESRSAACRRQSKLCPEPCVPYLIVNGYIPIASFDISHPHFLDWKRSRSQKTPPNRENWTASSPTRELLSQNFFMETFQIMAPFRLFVRPEYGSGDWHSVFRSAADRWAARRMFLSDTVEEQSCFHVDQSPTR